jgi:hypothetical protein
VRRSRRADAERLARLRGVQRKREHESRPGCRRRRRGLVGQYRGGEAQHARGYIVQSRPCPLRAVSRRRRVPREAPVGQRATTQGRPGGTAVVLARGVASKSSSLGTDLHGRSRACGVLDRDPLGVCIAVRKVRGRTSTSRTGTTSRRGGLIHAGVRSHLYSGQRGAPSYASVIDVPEPGCWRLHLSTGSLRASVVFRAIAGTT